MNDFTYTTLKTKRKTLVIEIKADKTVIVRAPLNCPDSLIESFVSSKSEWIKKHLSDLPQIKPPPSKEKIEQLRAIAKEYLPNRVEYWTSITGLRPSSVKITSAKRRFGSCSGKNSVCLSLFLMEYPYDAIDYVIVHELCHIRHKNHKKEFHSLIKKYLPDADNRIKLLKGK